MLIKSTFLSMNQKNIHGILLLNQFNKFGFNI